MFDTWLVPKVRCLLTALLASLCSFPGFSGGESVSPGDLAIQAKLDQLLVIDSGSGYEYLAAKFMVEFNTDTSKETKESVANSVDGTISGGIALLGFVEFSLSKPTENYNELFSIVERVKQNPSVKDAFPVTISDTQTD